VMSKRPSLVRQVEEALRAQSRFGQSRHAAKAAGVAREGIYAIRTFRAYLEEGVRFARWAQATHGVRWLAEAKPYVAEYLRVGQARGLSAWTIAKQASALRKVFQDYSLAREVAVHRALAAITRSREETVSGRAWARAHPDQVAALQATGLRGGKEASVIRGYQVERDAAGRTWIREVVGKGGRVRDVPVLPGRGEAALWRLVEQAGPDGRVFGRVPGAAQSHAYRRAYAQAFFTWRTGRAWAELSCAERRDPEIRAVLREISEALGHSREDVVVMHYLR